MDTEVELTELEKLEVTRVDAVTRPANGFPVLLMKGLPVAKGARDCPGCDKTYDADHKGDNCENCGKKLPDAPASKAAADGKVNCPTCKGDGKIMGGQRDCPDCDASGKVTPAKAKSLAAKSLAPARTLVRMALAAPDVPAAALFKAIAADGSVDEQPDIDGGRQAIALIAKLIGYEAQELAAGCLNETWDIQLLCEAAGALKCWLGGEQATQDGTLMQSAAKAAESAKTQNDLPDSAFAYIEPGGTKDEEGKTTPRSKRHFPVHDKAHADNAAARIAQGAEFGDKAKAKVTAAQRKFGEDTSKSAVAEGGTDVQTDAQGTGDLTEVVKAAVTEATADLRAQLATAQADLAKVLSRPVPGGPMLSAARPAKAAGGEEWAAKARYYREMADSVSQDPQAADGYRQLARQADDKAKQTT